MTPKAIHPFLVACLLCLPLKAQKPGTQSDDGIDPVEIEKAIAQFNRLKGESRKEANEVTVVLESPSDTSKPIEVDEPVEKPVLVTGKLPRKEAEQEAMNAPAPELTVEQEAQESGEVAETSDVAEAARETLDTAERSKPGLEVRVESIRPGKGKINPDEIVLRASFPAKPLSEAPQGWTLARSEDAPEFKRDVELQAGTSISLSIRPHLLAPAVDGASVFEVREPGFKAAEAYLQKETVSAILGTAVVQLDEDSKKIGKVIENLHQILSSLPKLERPSEDTNNP